jgi:hypothetical protein
MTLGIKPFVSLQTEIPRKRSAAICSRKECSNAMVRACVRGYN